jgi:ABC-type antimicrobial peptide transport system permease subunit
MMGTVGRLIADSRRETAVFRAIGAKRRDIAATYLLYMLLLSFFIALFAFIIGSGAMLVINHHFAPQATVQALVAYNAQDLNRSFSLFGLNALDMLLILGCVLAAGLISAILPLLRNIRRNPVRDMRDET